MSSTYREYIDPDCDGETQVECLRFSLQSFVESVRPDGSERRHLTDCGFCLFAAPSFSPDGRRLAYAAPPVPWVPGRPTGVVVARSNGARARRLPVAPGHLTDSQPSWSPDGRRLVFTGALDTPGPDTSIFVVAADGTGH